MKADESLAARFDADRPHLRAVAYRLLGSADDADDAVQAAWLKIDRADSHEVRNLTGWFTTVTARECLDQLRARRRRGEVALPGDGSALAPPAPPAEDEALLADSVGRALLVLLDRLSPAQRVAFVLHDLFALPFDEIGRLLERSPSAAKKLASRARERLRGGPSAERAPSAEQLRIADAFLAASRGGDLPALLDLLAPDVVRRVDRVLVPEGVATELRGARAVAEETRIFAARARAGAVAVVDGAPGAVIAPAGRLQAVLRLDIDGDRIRGIEIIGDPRRLAAVTLALPG
ncbi:sigma-70 family RNA polymerase sigma factor [Allonocardiopsis opalescens]|uniref:RNA polymerase sigma-70 factor (ECF subfamily) n=1 Tax=Allonocardiopsis opalescens TaxID=1144618 RepID=A0A2T0PZ54_9ACTN|nr:sigma-70 family RNA polymerase sigma factor [Allonocardiopsis opalescens]PRX96719.1 RNA polymerase sigma-70 factor (ECF subfamily) [Allonocardiopsis opalescens]